MRDYCPSQYERFRHSRWSNLRALTYEVLEQSGATDATLTRFAECGAYCQVNYSPSTKRLFLSSSNCKNRHCQPCANAKRSLIASNLRTAIGDAHCRLLTLTIAHHNRPLPELITRMKSSFKLLRKEEQWQKNVRAFAAFIEVKWSQRSDWWHVHMHILATGNWWDKRELSATWHAVTGDSMVTDIREVTSDEGINYTAKYAAKPFSLSDIPKSQRVNAVVGVGNRRMWQVGGEWTGKLKLLAKPTLPDDLTNVGSFTEILNDAGRGDEAAKTILEAIVGGAAVTLIDADDTPDFSSA